jgi:multidrug efflux system outer membrane protein
MKRKQISIFSCVLLAGCAVGPDYTTPDISVESQYAIDGPNMTIGTANQQQQWWRTYQDPLLTGLISRGLDQNLDLQAAMERIEQAQANVRKTGLNSALDGSVSAGLTNRGGTERSSTSGLSVGLDANFVIDLFGGIQRGRESAIASLVSAQADVQTVRLAWLAQIITTYSDARFYQQAIQFTKETIKARQETVAITQRQFDFGATTSYDLALTKALLATAEAVLPEYVALYNANVFAISTLLDEPAQPIFEQMQNNVIQLGTPAAIDIGIPADLLHNRPDVRSAEALLAATVANVGVAESQLYPSISLSGTLSESAGSSSWSFGPSIVLPVLNRGLLSASRDAAESLAKQSEINWRSVILSAVEDVQVAQSNLSQQRQRSTAFNEAASFYNQAFTLAQENYRAGAITLLQLLDTDRSTASARISSASAINDMAKAWATLEIALGAGQKVTVAE